MRPILPHSQDPLDDVLEYILQVRSIPSHEQELASNAADYQEPALTSAVVCHDDLYALLPVNDPDSLYTRISADTRVLQVHWPHSIEQYLSNELPSIGMDGYGEYRLCISSHAWR